MEHPWEDELHLVLLTIADARDPLTGQPHGGPR
jgi:hypothetical protein